MNIYNSVSPKRSSSSLWSKPQFHRHCASDHIWSVYPSGPLWDAALPVPAQPECFHRAPPERRAEPPIYDCAHNRRWQVKWLTCPLGLLTQECRTPRHCRWYWALHPVMEVRWGKSLRWNSGISSELFLNFRSVRPRSLTRTSLWTCLNSVLSICETSATCFKCSAEVEVQSMPSPLHRSGSLMSVRRDYEGNFTF